MKEGIAPRDGYEAPKLSLLGSWEAKVFQQSVPIGPRPLWEEIDELFDVKEFWK